MILVNGKKLVYPLELPARCGTTKLWMLEYICERMRPDEVEQYLAITGADEYRPAIAAAAFAANVNNGISVCHLDEEGKPTCAGGYAPDPYMPGVWQSWMCGTPEGWEKHWRTITKATKWGIQQLLDGGARRLETNVLASREHAIQWYEQSLGMKYEGVRREYTADGGDIKLFSITRKDWFAGEETE